MHKMTCLYIGSFITSFILDGRINVFKAAVTVHLHNYYLMTTT